MRLQKKPSFSGGFFLGFPGWFPRKLASDFGGSSWDSTQLRLIDQYAQRPRGGVRYPHQLVTARNASG